MRVRERVLKSVGYVKRATVKQNTKECPTQCFAVDRWDVREDERFAEAQPLRREGAPHCLFPRLPAFERTKRHSGTSFGSCKGAEKYPCESIGTQMHLELRSICLE
jgi:hypothetical protein